MILIAWFLHDSHRILLASIATVIHTYIPLHSIFHSIPYLYIYTLICKIYNVYIYIYIIYIYIMHIIVYNSVYIYIYHTYVHLFRLRLIWKCIKYSPAIPRLWFARHQWRLFLYTEWIFDMVAGASKNVEDFAERIPSSAQLRGKGFKPLSPPTNSQAKTTNISKPTRISQAHMYPYVSYTSINI